MMKTLKSSLHGMAAYVVVIALSSMLILALVALLAGAKYLIAPDRLLTPFEAFALLVFLVAGIAWFYHRHGE
jgi:hypothetical protein